MVADGTLTYDVVPEQGGGPAAGPGENADRDRDLDLDLDVESGRSANLATPQQWGLCCAAGSGQLERQGFELWTSAEQQQFYDRRLRSKWGIGQVTVRLPLGGCCALLALLYGFLPFLVPLWWLVWAIESGLRAGQPLFFPTYGLCVAASFALLNEAVLKQVCKRVLPRRLTLRPPEAVCTHPGMPSGHVMNAYTLMVWCLLETFFEPAVHVEWLLVIAVVLAPVPWARVHNRDHTCCQVAASVLVATGMGCAAFSIRTAFFPHHLAPWDYVNLGTGVKWGAADVGS